MGLLGGVDQQEEKRERSRRQSALLDRETVDLPQQLVEAGGAGLAMPARPCRNSQLFDDPECFLSFQPSNHPSEGAGKPANVLVQRKVFFSRRSWRWHGWKYRTPGYRQQRYLTAAAGYQGSP